MVSDREGLAELFHPDALRAIPGIPDDLEGRQGISVKNVTNDRFSGNMEAGFIKRKLTLEFIFYYLLFIVRVH